MRELCLKTVSNNKYKEVFMRFMSSELVPHWLKWRTNNTKVNVWSTCYVYGTLETLIVEFIQYMLVWIRFLVSNMKTSIKTFRFNIFSLF